jgi:hypothetical protein
MEEKVDQVQPQLQSEILDQKSPPMPNQLQINKPRKNNGLVLAIAICLLLLIPLGVAGCRLLLKNAPNAVLPMQTECGGWDTSGEIICECNGKMIKPVCPAKTECDSGTYTCQGTCGKCCYRGIAEGSKFPKCSE